MLHLGGVLEAMEIGKGGSNIGQRSCEDVVAVDLGNKVSLEVTLEAVASVWEIVCARFFVVSTLLEGSLIGRFSLRWCHRKGWPAIRAPSAFIVALFYSHTLL